MINHKGFLNGWVVQETDTAIHVSPNNDIKFHTVSQNNQCRCNPTHYTKYDKLIVIHNSFDGRKLIAPLTTLLS